MNNQYDNLMKKLRKQVKQKDGTIEKLHKKIEQLEQEKMNLHAAANDAEKEAATVVEYLERESELLIDADIWKQKARIYEAENKRLNNTLFDVRQDLTKYREESKAAAVYIKAVL